MRRVWLLAVHWAVAPARGAELDGTWVYRQEGQVLAMLTLQSAQQAGTGRLVQLKRLAYDQDGWVTSGGPGRFALEVSFQESTPGRIALTIDGDRYAMMATGPDRASFGLTGVQPWPMERVPPGTKVEMANQLRRAKYPAEITALQKRLKALVKEDQAARHNQDGDRMRAADHKSLSEVERIFARYGWVTYSLAGRDASGDFWLLVQHQDLAVQRRMLPALAKAVAAGEASRRLYAYLHDRVNTFEGKPQRWGTQVKCEGGKPALYPVEDADGLAERRKALGMPTVAEYLASPIIVKSCALAK